MTRLTIAISQDLLDRIKASADDQTLSVSAWLRLAAQDKLKKEAKEGKK